MNPRWRSSFASAMLTGALVGCTAACVAPSSVATPVQSADEGSPSAQASIGVAELDLTTLPMYLQDSPVGGASTLTVGLADGRVTYQVTIDYEERRIQRFSAMAGGRMAYAVSDPGETVITVVTADSGLMQEVSVAGAPIIWDLALDPAGEWAYFVAHTREVIVPEEGDDLGPTTGVWRVAVSGDGTPERVLPPPIPTDDDPVWKEPGRVYSPLWITGDGSMLLSVACITTADCRIRRVHLATGDIGDFTGAGIWNPRGVSDQWLVGAGDFTDPLHPLLVLDLTTGMVHSVPSAEDPERLTIQRSGAVALYAVPRDGNVLVRAVDVRNGFDRIVYQGAAPAYVPGYPAGIELPAGWAYLTLEPCGPLPPDLFGQLLNLQTGELVALGMEEEPPTPCDGQ